MQCSRMHISCAPVVGWLAGACLSLALAAPATAFVGPSPVRNDGAGGVEDQGDPRAGAEQEIVEVSTRRFLALSDFQIRELRRARRDGATIRIGGFSEVMTTWILHMANAERRRTQRLMRDMADLDTPEERSARLEREMERARDFEQNLVDSIERLEGRGQREAAREERSRLRNLRDFIDGLEQWIDFPHEGAR